jgi:hypothetical protein
MQRLVERGECFMDGTLYPVHRRFEEAAEMCVWNDPKSGIRFTMKVVLTATAIAQP